MAKGEFTISAYGWIIFVILIFIITLALVTGKFIPDIEAITPSFNFGL
jgi:hypothetical protein